MSGEQLHLEDVAVGQELPPMVKHATRAQLFLYSAATWNPHRIHYDAEYARTEGHPDVIVHGPLQGAWLTQFLTDWIGPRGRLLQASWQNRASALPEQDLTFRGRVVAIEGDRVTVELHEESQDGQVLMPGQAVVSLPSRGSGAGGGDPRSEDR
jgi:hydroxyacyl-ACP dehydratase HTD2-like protein with hotdog domain